MVQIKMHLLVCGGTGCRASESDILVEQLNHHLQLNGLADEVKVVTTGCFGFCEKGPIVKVIPDNTFYTQVTPEDAERLLKSTFSKVEKWHVFSMRTLKHWNTSVTQTHGVLSETGENSATQLRIHRSENIDEYIVRDGYAASVRCSHQTPRIPSNLLRNQV